MDGMPLNVILQEIPVTIIADRTTAEDVRQYEIDLTPDEIKEEWKWQRSVSY